MHTQGVCEGACMCVCVTAQGKPRFGFQLKEFKHNWKTDIRCSKTYDSALSRWALCFCGLFKSLICKEAREGQQGERTGTNGSHWERQLEEMLSFHYFWMGKLEVLERICVPKCVWPHEGLVAFKDPCGKTVGTFFHFQLSHSSHSEILKHTCLLTNVILPSFHHAPLQSGKEPLKAIMPQAPIQG